MFLRFLYLQQKVGGLVIGVHAFRWVTLAEQVGCRQDAQRTSAMAIGIMDAVWSVLRLLVRVVPPTGRTSSAPAWAATSARAAGPRGRRT